MTHEKTLLNFETMVTRVGGDIQMTANAAKQLLSAIADLQARNENLLMRNRLLRHRPDSALAVSFFHNEMERLQEIERGLLHDERDQFCGLTENEVKKFQGIGHCYNDEQFHSICALALERMDTYTDPNGSVWVTPTAYAYAQTCKAMHSWHDKAVLKDCQIAELNEQVSQLQKKDSDNG